MSVSGFMLERYLTGELDEAARARVEAELAANPDARAKLEAMQRARATFLEEEPYARFVVEHEARRRAKPRMRWRLAFPAFGFVAAAAAVALFVFEPAPTEQIKGAGVGLTLVLVNAGAPPRPLPAEALVHPNDHLQPTYDAGDHRFVALVGREADGALTAYYPASGHMAPVPDGRSGRLPLSLTLDASRGDETFVAVFADVPLELTEVVAALHDRRTLPGVQLATVVLHKAP